VQVEELLSNGYDTLRGSSQSVREVTIKLVRVNAYGNAEWRIAIEELPSLAFPSAYIVSMRKGITPHPHARV
jgi:hypothetical protein